MLGLYWRVGGVIASGSELVAVESVDSAVERIARTLASISRAKVAFDFDGSSFLEHRFWGWRGLTRDASYGQLRDLPCIICQIVCGARVVGAGA